MTKDIDTLIPDIYNLLEEGKEELTPEEDAAVEDFGKKVADVIRSRVLEKRTGGYLRMSMIGTPCERKLWYSVNTPEDAEKLRGPTYLKFLYGDLSEEMVLLLAKLTGHTVEGEQDTQEIAGIEGHRDAVVDGHLIDVKTASPYSFDKFKGHLTSDKDPFGYCDQLQSYMHAGQDDPLVTNKKQGGFLVMQKVSGDLHLDKHSYQKLPWEAYYESKKAVVAQDTPPPRGFMPEPHQKSGNKKLCIQCSYCQFKKKCWPEMRTFLYGRTPVHLVEVVREPKVPELDVASES